MKLEESKVKASLTNLLNECLESYNQEHSFKVIKTDLINMKFTVEFDIVAPEENGQLYFNGY